MITLPLCDERSAYESGRSPGNAGWLLRPGGVELTLRAVGLAGLGNGTRVLDLGCGSGETVNVLRGHGIDAVGVDSSLNLSHSRARGCESPFVRGSAEELPLPYSSVDGVLAECSLSVMKNPRKALLECARVLRPEGKLMISDLYARNPDAIQAVRSIATSCVSGMIVRGDLESWLLESGFAIELFEDHSQALREVAAQYIFDHGSLETLWTRGERTSDSQELATAMKRVRAGYFLLIATHVKEA